MKKQSIPHIRLFTAPGCSHCRQAREFLAHHQIPFQELDVQRSPKARKQLMRMGARGVPVLLVGEQRIDGFRPGSLRRLLGTLQRLKYQPCLSMAPSSALRQGLHTTSMRPLARLEYEALSGAILVF